MDIAGLRAVALPLPERASSRYVYIKKHSATGERNDGRTLFLTNVPPFVSANSVQEMFSGAGTLDSVSFGIARSKKKAKAQPTSPLKLQPDFNHNLFPGLSLPSAGNTPLIASTTATVKVSSKADMARTSHGFAHICFQSKDDARNALNQKTGKIYHQLKPHGIAKWLKQYEDAYVDVDVAEAEANDFMRYFDEETEAEERAAASGPIVDKDGFTLVQRRPGKRKGPSQHVELAQPKKKKDKVLGDFYKFQKVQQRQEKIEELRRKFEEDKARIQKMRGDRRFRPY